MANSSKTIFIASGFSLLLAIASTHAGAQTSRDENEPEPQPQRTTATKNFDLPELGGIESFFDNLMKAIVRSYRNTVNLGDAKNNEAIREAVREKRLAAALDKKLRASPHLIQSKAASPKTQNARSVVAVNKTKTAPQQSPQKRVSQLAPSQAAAAKSASSPKQAPTVASNTAQKAAAPVTPAKATPAKATPVVGSAKLSWNIPTQRENGERLPLNEIASYEIYVTAEEAGTSRTIRLNNRNQTQFTLKPLSEDTYYFSMVTVDTEGTYSELSQVVSKTIK